MATVFRRKNRTGFYGRFMVNGKAYCISTGTDNKREAEKIMQRKIAEIKGDLSLNEQFDGLLRLIDSLPQEDQDNQRHEFARQLLQGNYNKLKIDEAWETWLNSSKKRNPAQKTINGYIAIWKRFQEWAQDQGREYMHEISRKDADDYTDHIWAQGFSPRTYNAHLKFLRSMFKTLQLKAGIIENVWEGIPAMEKDQESRRDLTPEEIGKVLNTAEGWMQPLFALGTFTGMRLGDCVSLRWVAIDLDQGMIEHMPQKTMRKKKIVRLAIPAALDGILRSWKASTAGTGYLFPVQQKRYLKDAAAITKTLQQHFQSCGIKTTEAPKTAHRLKSIIRVGFHSLRHSFVSICVKNGIPLLAIQSMVGHGSPAMTRNYSHISDSQKEQAAAMLSNIIPFTDNVA
jgi:integrase